MSKYVHVTNCGTFNEHLEFVLCLIATNAHKLKLKLKRKTNIVDGSIITGPKNQDYTPSNSLSYLHQKVQATQSQSKTLSFGEHFWISLIVRLNQT